MLLALLHLTLELLILHLILDLAVSVPKNVDDGSFLFLFVIRVNGFNHSYAPRAPPPRSRHEELRRQRLAEFMDGFGQITLRLKEMYQVGEQTAQYPYRQSGGCYSQRQYCTVL